MKIVTGYIVEAIKKNKIIEAHSKLKVYFSGLILPEFIYQSMEVKIVCECLYLLPLVDSLNKDIDYPLEKDITLYWYKLNNKERVAILKTYILSDLRLDSIEKKLINIFREDYYVEMIDIILNKINEEGDLILTI